MTHSVVSDELSTNWSLIAVLLLLACGLIIGAAYRPDDYFRSVMLEAATGIFLFVAIQSLLGREVDEHERTIARAVGVIGFVIVIAASFTGAFPQSILIEIGMGALLFWVLDVIIVRRLKRRIENLEQQVRESFDEIEEIENRERAFGKLIGKFIDVENWDPDDFWSGYPNNYGGFDTEDNDSEWRG